VRSSLRYVTDLHKTTFTYDLILKYCIAYQSNGIMLGKRLPIIYIMLYTEICMGINPQTNLTMYKLVQQIRKLR